MNPDQDIGIVRQRLLMRGFSLSDADRELEISRLGAEIEFLGISARARDLCARLVQLINDRPPEYIEALERALGISGGVRD